MKNRLFLHLICCTLLIYPASCKKFIQQQEENALVDLVTKGTWRVSRYQDHQADVTSTFTGYVFQFNADGTVTGTLQSQATNGVWVGDVNARTIQSNFPAAADPLKLLNYTWKITDSYSDSVSARTPVDSIYNYLELHKN